MKKVIHVTVKNIDLFFQKRKVQICINATVPSNSNLPLPIAGGGLKNVAHGTVSSRKTFDLVKMILFCL
jgi:hypothetical protein